MNKVLKLIFNAPKITLIGILLIGFFIIETIFLIIYTLFETPMRFVLDKVELYIRYLTKQLK